jgi:hypothetical protein
MSTTKTPLELVNTIKGHTVALFELRRVSKALLETSSLEDVEVTRTIVRSLANTCIGLSNHVSDIYWDVSDLKRIMEDNLLEETKDLEEDLPFVTPSEEVEA